MWKLKLDENGNAVLVDGKPVYINDEGKEINYDVNENLSKIAQLNGEAKSHREAKQALETKLKTFEGIEDPAKAIEAIQKLTDLDTKKLIDAGEVEKVKAEMAKTFQSQIDEAKAQVQTLTQQLYDEKIGGSFARSKFITEKLAIPHDVAQAFFGHAFSIKDGQIVAKDATGQEIYSRNPETAGSVAGFDEALSVLVEAYPNKNALLKSSGMSGGGEQSPSGGSHVTNPWAKDSWNLTQQGEMYKKDKATAIQMAAKHGVKLS